MTKDPASQRHAQHPINHLKRHLVTCTNIAEASSANSEIVRVLLHMFRDIYVQENCANEEESATILQIMFQIRCKTHLKIVNIELARRVDTDEYSFLFGSAWRAAPATRDSAQMGTGAAGVAAKIPQYEVMMLYIDIDTLELALSRVVAATPSTSTGDEGNPARLTCYSNIVDAMAHAPRPRKSNVFEMCVLEVQACHAQKIMQESFAQFARTNEQYAVVSADHVAAKMFLKIELRGLVDAWTNYRYGPFPTLDNEAHDDCCRRRRA
jgi:hypothetical protein